MEELSSIQAGAQTRAAATFSNMPDEIISHILSFLNVIDISNSTVVCKRWQHVSHAAKLQKNVIIDLLKCKTHRPIPVPDIILDGIEVNIHDFCDPRESGLSSLINKFVTPKTRNVIMRWSFGSSSPEPVLYFDETWEYEAIDIQRQLFDIFQILRRTAARHSLAGITLTLQNIHLGADTLQRIIPDCVAEIHLEDITMHCHFPTGSLMKEEPQIVRKLLVEKASVGKVNGAWPFDRQGRNDNAPSFMFTAISTEKMKSFEFFGQFLPASLSAEEEAVIQRKVQSKDPVGASLVSYLFIHAGWPKPADGINPLMPVSTLNVTLDRIRTLPLWLQHLTVQLLSRYAD
ncbi:uncharacterized protein LOC129591519 [Paramacrobiotus metropolitanus]|uniref:uncharacterized protein LOC129591519 n=1 Tax=Paramacrobiotus metropolitanus TaxID=2943436 RepID=UPI002445EF49|nr:uncharacterized protein LOC129591519 [Paramacrobiotus metropolitanus]